MINLESPKEKDVQKAVKTDLQRLNVFLYKMGIQVYSIITNIGSFTGTFLSLSDTPASYAGQTGKAVAVNGAETALEFIAFPAGYTDEQAQDAVGAMIDSTLNYVDGTPLLQRAALTGDVTAPAGSNVMTFSPNGIAARDLFLYMAAT